MLQRSKQLIYSTELNGEHKVKAGINPVNDMSSQAGIELALLLTGSEKTDPFTDWLTSLFSWEYLIKDLLVIGKPSMLDHFDTNTQPKVSTRLMQLLEYFQSLQDDDSARDWLTWLMLDQFECDTDYTHEEEKALLESLKVNP